MNEYAEVFDGQEIVPEAEIWVFHARDVLAHVGEGRVWKSEGRFGEEVEGEDGGGWQGEENGEVEFETA